jgi:hypothetical protein
MDIQRFFNIKLTKTKNRNFFLINDFGHILNFDFWTRNRQLN